MHPGERRALERYTVAERANAPRLRVRKLAVTERSAAAVAASFE